MALADMYKTNNVSYYESGAAISGIFTDTLANLLADNDLDYSIFLNCGCDWSYLNTGCKGNHFSMYPDWVGGVLAIRQGPATHDIKYVGSAVMSKTNTAAVINITKQLGDNSGFLNSRFLIDVIPGTYGAAASYNSFNYAGYTGQKFGFNSCILQSTSYYRPTNTAHTGTFISDYTALTGDDAKRLTASAFQILATNYNPYMADSDSLLSFAVGYLYMFFEIDGELIAVRNLAAMPNTAHWQSWFKYTDNGTDVYVSIGKYDDAVTVGSQGALPSSDDVKGIYCYNYNGTCQNCYSTKNAISYLANCYGLRWMIGNTGLSTAGDWRTKVLLGVMSSAGIIDHDNWLVGESAIQASDNPNKNTDYDHIPKHGGGGGGSDEDEDTAISTAGAPYAKGLVNYYAMTAGSNLIDHISEALSTWDLQNTGKDLYKNLVSCKLIKPPAAIPTSGSEPLTIYGEKPQYQGADITLPVVSGNPDASFGPYSISRKFNDFRDYAPYTRVCIYLPYCGWCDLPSHVVGRSVSVKYFTDIIAATVRAVVFCNNNIIAEAAGVMGLDIPFTADAVGMKQAGVVSGLTAYAGGALQTAAGVASIVTTKGGKGIGETLSGASKLVSAYTQTAQAFNENTTEISGKNGDGCSLSGATKIIIKIIRPKYGASSDPPYVPDGFAHSVGFVSNKQVRVGNVSGLLIADNVDTSGIAGATDAERAEIKRVLETGLIVNDAPE